MRFYDLLASKKKSTSQEKSHFALMEIIAHGDNDQYQERGSNQDTTLIRIPTAYLLPLHMPPFGPDKE